MLDFSKIIFNSCLLVVTITRLQRKLFPEYELPMWKLTVTHLKNFRCLNLCIYLLWRKRDLPSLICHPCPKLKQCAKLVQATIENPKLYLISPTLVFPSTWQVHCCFPRFMRRKLEWRGILVSDIRYHHSKWWFISW